MNVLEFLALAIPVMLSIPILAFTVWTCVLIVRRNRKLRDGVNSGKR